MTNSTISVLDFKATDIIVKKNECKKLILSVQCLQFPIQIKEMTKEETKKYHLKKLYNLSLKSVGQIPHLEEPTEEQKEWFERRLKRPASSWKC